MSSHQIRWKGQVTGPHSLEDIRTLLSTGEVSRMHQIEHAGQWRSLEEFLREAEESERAQAAVNARDEELARRRVERELADERIRTAALEQQFAWLQEKQGRNREAQVEAPKRRISHLAITAFVLSFCSFCSFICFLYFKSWVPLVVASVSWIPPLILGHAALADMDRDHDLDGRSLAQGAIITPCTVLVLGALLLMGAAIGLVKP
jgi:hypothetical protein